MFERKPSRIAKPSGAALKAGAELYSVFRRFVPLEGPLTTAAVTAIAQESGLGARRIRELARRFRAKPIAESLASLPKGPKPGKKHACAKILTIIDTQIEEVFLRKPPPRVREAANQIRSLLIADNGDYRFDATDVPSARTIERIIDEISSPQLARSTMGSKRRTAYEPHPGQYLSDGFLDVVQMDHSPANVILVDSVHRKALGRPWVTLLIDVWSRCILGFYVSFGDPSIFRGGRAVANALLPKQPLLTGLGWRKITLCMAFSSGCTPILLRRIALKCSEVPATRMGSIPMYVRVVRRTWADISSVSSALCRTRCCCFPAQRAAMLPSATDTILRRRQA